MHQKPVAKVGETDITIVLELFADVEEAEDQAGRCPLMKGCHETRPRTTIAVTRRILIDQTITSMTKTLGDVVVQIDIATVVTT